MSVVGAAIKGFGKALSKKSGTIKSVKPAQNLTSRRESLDKLTKSVSKQFKSAGVKEGSEASKLKKKFWKESSDIHDKYEKDVKARKDYNKKLKRKVIGGATAAVVGLTGAHGAAKKKWPKYKKFMESSVTIKNGKLGLREKKEK